MKIAISMRHKKVSSHLGSSTGFVILALDEAGTICEMKSIKSPRFHRNIPVFLDLEHVDVVVTKDMCPRAHELLKELGIGRVICDKSSLEETVNFVQQQFPLLQRSMSAA